MRRLIPLVVLTVFASGLALGQGSRPVTTPQTPAAAATPTAKQVPNASRAAAPARAPVYAPVDDEVGEEVYADDGEAVSFAYADVLRSDPVYAKVEDSNPEEVCEDVEVRRTRHNGSGAGAVIGAIVGAALGNQVGKGDGRKAATVAGAVIGGTIGHEAGEDSDRSYSDVETQCHVEENIQTRRELIGYDVEYRYRGEVYYTRLDTDPGDRLRIRVAVSPAQ
jgi:uncharacterized protein YcfJ